MNCKCRRCNTESSVFWHPFVYGYTQGRHTIEEGDVFFLCDQCLHDLVLFFDIELYMLKERIQ